jgi:hypothetical protein
MLTLDNVIFEGVTGKDLGYSAAYLIHTHTHTHARTAILGNSVCVCLFIITKKPSWTVTVDRCWMPLQDSVSHNYRKALRVLSAAAATHSPTAELKPFAMIASADAAGPWFR